MERKVLMGYSRNVGKGLTVRNSKGKMQCGIPHSFHIQDLDMGYQ